MIGQFLHWLFSLFLVSRRRVIRLRGAEPGAFVLAVGNVENSVCLSGYNQLSNYVLDNPDEPGLSWCVEPNYKSPSTGNRTMEGYLQALFPPASPTNLCRILMTQIDCVTKRPTWTELTGGELLSLCLLDGPGQSASGRQCVILTAASLDIKPPLLTGGDPWRILGLDGGALLLVEVSGQRYHVPFRPSQPSPRRSPLRSDRSQGLGPGARGV